MRIILAPFDIVVKLCWRAPKALVKKVAKEEYVLWTEIGLCCLISPKNSVLGQRVEDPLFASYLCICHSLRSLSNQWPFLDPSKCVSAKTIALMEVDDEGVEG